MRIRIVNVDAWPACDLLHAWRTHIGVSAPTLVSAAQSGALRTQRSGRHHLVFKEDVLAWLGADPAQHGQVGLLNEPWPPRLRRRQRKGKTQNETTA